MTFGTTRSATKTSTMPRGTGPRAGYHRQNINTLGLTLRSTMILKVNSYSYLSWSILQAYLIVFLISFLLLGLISHSLYFF